VTVLGRREAPLREVVAALPGGRARPCDVADEAAVQAAFSALPPVDLLVNCAGAAAAAPFLKMSLEHFRSMLEANLVSAFLCSRAVAPAMLQAGFGRIVNVASTAGLRGYPYIAGYAAAKHGLVGLTRALAAEFARSGVTVNAICPGYADTEIVRAAVANIQAKTGRTAEQALAELVKHNPQGRLVLPEEAADAVAWLCGAEAGAVTGQAIGVAGGEV
jgi:NAD(P)-dependent dehydrogenase (short-subunit alcohol dehydrogenase family)